MDTRLKKSKKLLEKEKDDFETTYCDGVDSIYDYVNELNRSKVSGGNLAKYSNEANTYFKSAEALGAYLGSKFIEMHCYNVIVSVLQLLYTV